MERKKIKCLWCGKEFEWDSSMFKFCDHCIIQIEKIENHLKNSSLCRIFEEVLSKR